METRAGDTGKWQGPLLILAAAVLWSAAGIGIKSLSLPAMAIAGFRSAFALPVIAVFLSRHLRPAAYRRPAVAGTALAYCLTMSFFVAANRLTTAANAILLQYTSPIWISALSYPLLREKPSRRDLAVAAICLAGLTIFFFDSLTAQGLLGMIFAILAGVAMALLVLGLRHEGRRGQDSAAGAVIFGGNLLCVAAGLPFMAASVPSMTSRDWAYLALLGTLQIGLSYVLFSAGLRRVPALKATMLGLLEPVLNPVWVAIGTGEVPGPAAIAGGGIVIGCLALNALVPRRPLTE